MDTKTLVEQFNERFPVGSKVMWRSVNHPNYDHTEYEVRAGATFAQMLLENSVEEDSEIAKITSDGFWEFHENF